MSLRSNLFADDPSLEACLVDHAAHVTPGAVGEHVGKIQIALQLLDDLQINPDELKAQRYGASTANAVSRFKTTRKIVNTSYQTQVDNIVGKMTIAALDEEMLDLESSLAVSSSRCRFGKRPRQTRRA